MGINVLVTGFEPFGGEEINASWEAVRRLPETQGRLRVHRLQLPCVYAQAMPALEKALEQEDYAAVLCVGQAASRTHITPERIGINCDDASLADNAGVVKSGEPIVPGGPAAYFSTLPVKEFVREMRARDIPACLSDSAGTYLCNHALYSALHLAATGFPGLRCGFVHVPATVRQQARPHLPGLPLELIVQGLRACLDVLERTL